MHSGFCFRFVNLWCNPLADPGKGPDTPHPTPPILSLSHTFSPKNTRVGDWHPLHPPNRKSWIRPVIDKENVSSIYHRHIEHFFTFLAGNTVFSLVSESPR